MSAKLSISRRLVEAYETYMDIRRIYRDEDNAEIGSFGT